jgi:hypothetical protein
LDFFSQEELAIIKTVLQKIEENESCNKTLDLQTRVCSFLAPKFAQRSHGACKKRSKTKGV